LSGAGLSITVTGGVEDEVEGQIASSIQALPPELAPENTEQAALLGQRALAKFVSARAAGNVRVTEKAVPGQGRLRRATGLLRRETLVEVAGGEPEQEPSRSIDDLVREAAHEMQEGA
jgi:hypothetical protein